MKAKVLALSAAERCRNILAASFEANLNTVKADAGSSADAIYTSKVHYMFHKDAPYIFVPERDLHSENVASDERGSLSMCSPTPGPLMKVLKSLKKLPPRVAFTGDMVHIKGKKVQGVTDTLKEYMLCERKIASQASHAVSSLLSSAGLSCKPRGEILLEILNQISSYNVYKFEIGSCIYIDMDENHHFPEDIEVRENDLLMPFSGRIIDGINRSPLRRRTLALLCFAYHGVGASDALMLSVDRCGFDVLAKTEGEWKELRFRFEEEINGVEDFCSELVSMEEQAVENLEGNLSALASEERAATC